jgi:hypothetical protein
MPPVAFEPTILIFERTITFRSLDRTATLIGIICILKDILREVHVKEDGIRA